jgi:LuxR family maltose regulon positive regulatory protein
MTQIVAPPVEAHPAMAFSVGLPDLEDSVIVRPRLEQQLRAVESSPLTVVEAPMGTGKTLGVACWAARQAAVDGVLWLDAGRCGAGPGADDRQLFWNRIRSGLTDLGMGPTPAPPPRSGTEASWARWSATLADALDSGGGTWLLVLDDYPSGPTGSLGRQIGGLLARTTALRLVITCTGSPALDLAQAGMAGRMAHLGPKELWLDEQEVAEILAHQGAPADRATGAAVCALTQGWALGVDLAARALAASSDSVAVLAELPLVLDELVEREVLVQLPAGGRELVIRTSVVPEILPGLDRAIMGGAEVTPISWVESAQGFVELGRDGSWRCHPLLRRSALRRLDQDWPALSRETRQAAARWHVEHGDRSAGLDLAAEIADQAWAADALVRSMAVPSIMLGAPDEATAGILRRLEAGTTEPLIDAAGAVSAGEPQVAEAALARRVDVPGAHSPAALAHRLTTGVIQMAIARQRTDADKGLSWVTECRRLVAELDPAQLHAAPELSSVIAAHESAFLMWKGDLVRAATVVEPAVQATPESAAEGIAVTECAGLLAWLEALRGDLTAAGRRAAGVLTIRPADSAEVGVGYAQLATAWVHLERGELEQALQRLDHTVGTRTRDPWLATAQRLAAARVATLRGEPEVAVRLLTDVRQTQAAAQAGWLADRFTVALAEAHLASGDPQRALAVLTPEPRHSWVEARAVAASARLLVGDRRGARALLAAIGDGTADAPLPAVVQVWSLEALLASEMGESERALSLVGRALRAADREELRAALSRVTPWLPAFANRHPDRFRHHRTFLTSLPTDGRRPRTAEHLEPATGLLEPLTGRELQVLERLAQFQTTDEIAGELFLSVNTVKTHVKSLFLKLSVNRRGDAVRRGRGLGLC